MAQSIYHPATSRGYVDLGWLKSYHTFSFGNYYDPQRINFGALRVLNDDTLDGGHGFGEHPHDNMEIISIPLSGGLKHIDSMDNVAVIGDGDIQVMSAGTGIFHEEHNDDAQAAAQFLQIWVYPHTLNVEPRYDQLTLNKADRHNKLQQILSPGKEDSGVWIHQNAWFNLGRFDKGLTAPYVIKASANGVYIFIISGTVKVNGQTLSTRDGLGIWETDKIELELLEVSEFLLMDVPMSF
ncbi:pirin family protein [Mucilaginibacter antarcticus]|uniref:Pirin family protein n=1 Tax=Mucilaginibacter antarcticus TaxID=1855725 RepID=A0ABW5XP10_9SPHI